MKVFTVTTEHPEWEALTRECVLRVKSYSGLDVKVFKAKDQWDAHVLKLSLPLEYDCPVWFIDSDWWALRPFEFPEIPEFGICAPRCLSGKNRYITTCADTEKIFGTTIIGMDMSSWKMKHVFRQAQALQNSLFWNGKPIMDEFFLNLSALKNETPISYTEGPWIWNAQDPPPEAVGVHSGGFWPKLEWLKKAVEKGVD